MNKEKKQMQLKKAYIALIALVLMLVCTSGAYAQPGINITVGFLGAAGVNETASTRTAETSDYNTTGSAIRVTGTVAIAPGAPVTTTTLRLSFGLPITSAPVPATSNGGFTAPLGVYGCPGFTGSSFGGVTVIPAVGTGSPVCPVVPAAGVPSTDPIRIYGVSGIFSGGAGSTVSIYTINYAAGTITVILPGFDPASPFSGGGTITTSSTGTFLLEGVRLDVSGTTATTVSVTPTLGALANNYNLVTTSLQVINALQGGLASIKQEARIAGTTANAGVATIFTNGVLGKTPNTGTLTLREGYVGAWRATSDYKRLNTGGGDVPNGTQFRLTFTGIPTGVTLSFATESSSGSSSAVPPTNVGATYSGSATAASPTVTITCSPCGSQAAVDALAITVTASAPTATSLPAGTITVTVSMAPIGAQFDSNNLPTASDGFPKFVALEVGTAGAGTTGAVIVNIIAASTTMLVPFIYVGPGGFDTGIEVANTTTDPFGAANGGAVPAAGSLTVTFYPTVATGGAGTAVVYGPTSSTAKVGFGLSSDGTLASGAVYTVNASQLLPAGTTQFVGYAFIQANFLNAHGTATISDYRTYSLTSHVLVMPPPLSFTRAQTLEGGINTNTAPGLGF